MLYWKIFHLYNGVELYGENEPGRNRGRPTAIHSFHANVPTYDRVISLDEQLNCEQYEKGGSPAV